MAIRCSILHPLPPNTLGIKCKCQNSENIGVIVEVPAVCVRTIRFDSKGQSEPKFLVDLGIYFPTETLLLF